MLNKTLKRVKRKIRLKAKEILLGRTKAGENVFVSRSSKLDSGELPAIIIYPNNEKIQKFNEAPKDYKRIFTLSIEVIGTAPTDDELDDLIEDMAEQIESLMEQAETDDEKGFGKLISSLELVGTQYAVDPEGGDPIASIKLDFELVFYADAITEDVSPLPDLKGVDVKWQVGHNADSPDTGDNLDADGDGDDGGIDAQTKVDIT